MYAFIPDASFVGTAFVNAVSNLLATTARDVVLAIEPQEGAQIANNGVLGSHNCLPASWGTAVHLRSMQFGQSKDLVVRLQNVPANGPYVHVGVSFDLGSSEQPSKIAVDGVDVCFYFCLFSFLMHHHLQRNGGAEITVQKIRLQFVETVARVMSCAHKNDLNGAATIIRQFIEEINRSDAAANDAVKALVTDLAGQVTEAVSKAEYYKKWGRHYLPSLMRAHQLQQCNNFKDVSVQFYGGVLFKSERDNVDEIFCKVCERRKKEKFCLLIISFFFFF